MEQDVETLLKRQKTRTIIMGVVIGILFLISLGLYFYGLIKTIEAERNYSDAVIFRDRLTMGQNEAEKQRQMAEQARQAQEQAQSALQKALKK
jgi:hypothetical protein